MKRTMTENQKDCGSWFGHLVLGWSVLDCMDCVRVACHCVLVHVAVRSSY